MNLESFNHLRSKLKDLKYKVDGQYEKIAHGGSEWDIEEVGREIVSPFLKALGLDETKWGDVWLVVSSNSAEIVIERVGLGKEMRRDGLLKWVDGKFAKLGILTDGNEFQFYTDAKSPGQMDDSPYWSFKLTTIKDDDIKVLLSYCKENLDVTLSNMASIVWASHFLKQMEKNESNILYESVKKSMESLDPAYGSPSIEEAKHSLNILLSFMAPVPEFSLGSLTPEMPKNGRKSRSSSLYKIGENSLEPLGAERQHSFTLESARDITKCKIRGYKFGDREKEYVNSFAMAFVDIISILVNDCGLLADHSEIGNSDYFRRVGEKEKAPWGNWKAIRNNSKWEINTCTSNPYKIQLLRDYFRLLNLPLSSLTLYF